MDTPTSNSEGHATDTSGQPPDVIAAHNLASLSAVEILGAHIADLMTAAAVKLGLYEGGEQDRDLADARILITSLAGLLDAAGPLVGSQHATILRDGLRTLQLAFREASTVPDEPGDGPGETYTGAVFPPGSAKRANRMRETRG